MQIYELIPYIKMGVVSLITVLVTVLVYQLDKKNKTFHNIGYWKKQIIIGVIFGVLSILGTEFGIYVNGAIANLRDAAPVCAGLIFGGPAGIIAGCIGGFERWFAVYWGAGEFTRIACALGTICAGFFAAFVRKYMMEDKIPGWIYAFFIGMVAEVFHMLLVFLTNVADVQTAFSVVKQTAPVMIAFNSITIAIVVMAVNFSGKENLNYLKGQKKIVQSIQASLLVVVVISFILANMFVVLINTSIALDDADYEMLNEMKDIERDISTELDEGSDFDSAVNHAIENARICDTGCVVLFDRSGKVLNYGKNSTKKINDSLTGHFDEIIESGERVCQKYEVGGEPCFVEYICLGYDYLVATYPEKEAYITRNTTIYITNFILLEVLAALFVGIYILIRKIVVNNIRKINQKLAKIAAGNLDIVVDVKSNEEFASLSNDINSTVETLKHYIDEAESRIDQELEFAKNIQASALSKDYPVSKYYELYANMKPAREVGGDFYDFYRIGKDKCVFLVADVSGKGIPAAMFMMKAKTLLKSLVDTGAGVDTVFTKANEELCKGNEAGMFVTSWMGILDFNTGVVQYANAGHNHPVIKKKDGSVEFVKSRPGLVLAGMEGIKYRLNEVTLAKGDSLYLYTDGVTEAMNSRDELYGNDRLLYAVKQAVNMKPKEMCIFIKDDLDAFVDGADQFDDITMLAIRFREDNEDESEKYIVPKDNTVPEILSFVEGRLEALDVPMKTVARTGIIADEIYSNITQYSGATIARIKCDIEDGDLILLTEDNGIEYNPLQREAPDLNVSVEEREIGGLGIHMVTQMCKDVSYSRKNGRNILTMHIEIK